MRSAGFRFKQFHVNHDRCAMKVGTDGVLLGAWADVNSARQILDLGTGSGLIALMLAQRSAEESQIYAVELDPAAAQQAQENVAASPCDSISCCMVGGGIFLPHATGQNQLCLTF